jgi:hypothetical protein
MHCCVADRTFPHFRSTLQTFYWCRCSRPLSLLLLVVLFLLRRFLSSAISIMYTFGLNLWILLLSTRSKEEATYFVLRLHFYHISSYLYLNSKCDREHFNYDLEKNVFRTRHFSWFPFLTLILVSVVSATNSFAACKINLLMIVRLSSRMSLGEYWVISYTPFVLHTTTWRLNHKLLNECSSLVQYFVT